MAEYFSTPCQSLDREHLVKRLSVYIDKNPISVPKLGVCQICGHSLPASHCAVRWDPVAKGSECVEGKTGSKEAEKMETAIREGKQFSDDGWSIARVGVCAKVADEEVWRQAKLAAEEIERQRRARWNTGAAASDTTKRMRGEPTRIGKQNLLGG